MDKIIFILRVSLILSLTSLVFVVGFGFGSKAFELPILKETNINYNCESDNIKDSLRCLNKEFNSFYVYNLSNQNLTLSEDEFRNVGGVCTHATTWYKNKLDSLGYQTKEVSLYPIDIKYSGHRFLITYDNYVNTYCIVEQNKYYCEDLAK